MKYILFFEILIICFKIIKIFGRSNQNFKICELFNNVYLWEPDKNFVKNLICLKLPFIFYFCYKY